MVTFKKSFNVPRKSKSPNVLGPYMPYIIEEQVTIIVIVTK